MPAASAGLLRFFEEETEGVKVRPELLMVASVAMIVVSVLARTSVTPNMMTWFGFILILVATALVAIGYPFAAGWVVLFSGFFDIIDGALARRTNQVTRFGGVLDSTLDRLSESAILLGIMAFFMFHAGTESWLTPYIVILVGATLAFSLLVSYIRSRAESAGVDCQVGIFTRTERVIILALGLLIGMNLALVIALAIIAVLSIVTVIQRLLYVYQKMR